MRGIWIQLLRVNRKWGLPNSWNFRLLFPKLGALQFIGLIFVFEVLVLFECIASGHCYTLAFIVRSLPLLLSHETSALFGSRAGFQLLSLSANHKLQHFSRVLWGPLWILLHRSLKDEIIRCRQIFIVVDFSYTLTTAFIRGRHLYTKWGVRNQKRLSVANSMHNGKKWKLLNLQMLYR